MQKRRERIEQWRAARKAKQEDVVVVEAAPASRKWTLEDEDDEDAENDVAATQNGDTEDVDPLDAYMQVVCHSSVVITALPDLLIPNPTRARFLMENLAAARASFLP